jgi:hypothetical protein
LKDAPSQGGQLGQKKKEKRSSLAAFNGPAHGHLHVLSAKLLNLIAKTSACHDEADHASRVRELPSSTFLFFRVSIFFQTPGGGPYARYGV